MASNWLFQSEEPYQENVQKSKHEELFVFGYGCKIFRDDDQASLVDAGKYLIPWMGDERLKIDRYDGRGHLYDLTPYDADLTKGQREELSEDEKKIEALCDEERYLELHTDLTEKSMYEEEEWKRYYESLSEGYKAVGFSYDHYGQPYGYTEEVVKEEDPEEQPYVPHPELHLPKGVQIPLTNKEAAIVEKTAKFIASHGMQMEIMMKTKQANNPKFMFMHFEDPLHPYYRHVVKMIKSGKFKPVFEEVKQEEPDHDDEAGGDGDGHHSYLHPALLQTNRASPTPEVYKPVQIQMPKVSIHETSYGQLLKSLSKVNQEVADKMKPKETIKTEPQDDTGLPACMAQPVYGPPVSSHNGVPPPPGIEPVTLPQNDEYQDGEVKEDGSSPMDHSHLAHIVPPPPDIQPVVDRMAMYVAKNGVEFEIVVKSKNDARFEFLHSHHVHFAYYDFKKQLFIKEMEREKKEKEKEKEEQEEQEEEQENEDKEKSSSGVGIKFKVKMKGKEQEALTLDKKKVFENESSEEEEQDGERSERERAGKSGSSTPVVVENTHIPSAKADVDPATAERKLAEQRMRDRIAASAREKLSQVDKEKQLQAERKRKAAMFINMLKGGNSDSGAGAANDLDVSERLSAQTPSGTSTPASSEKSSSGRQKSKSKHKRKDKRRSRSRERSRSRSRDRRSRSKSSSRSKKKKRKRSPTPPSAYAVTRRSPLRFPPPPPPRYQSKDRSPSNSRTSRHISRSPSNSRSSRYRSKSKSRSPIRSKSKKKRKSRSQSPSRSKSKDSKPHKAKKKKKKRSKSRSPKRKSSGPLSADPELKKVDSSVSIQSMQSEDRVSTPVAVESELEEGETRETTPEAEEVKKADVASLDLRRSLSPNDVKSKRSRSRTQSKSRSFSPSSVKSDKSPPTSRHSSVSRHSSRSNRSSRSRSRHSSRSSRHSSCESLRKSRSKSPKKRSESPRKQSESPWKRSQSPEAHKSSSAPIPSCPASPDKDSDCDSIKSGTSTPKAATGAGTQKNVSQYMLNRVRAIIKASREAMLKEDGPFLNNS